MFELPIIIFLIIFSALFSGLTLGLMSLSAPELARKMELGNQDARKVYAVRKNGNLLLTTLLVGNVLVNSILAVFLNSFASGVWAVVISTSLIVVFGEITPQAVFSRYALLLGAKTAWLVRIFMACLYPITAPIAWILDKTLGEELPTVYSKKELMKIIEEHEGSGKSTIDAEEERIVKGALSFSDKTVKNVMTPRSVIHNLDAKTIIDKKLLTMLRKAPQSRLPVYRDNPDNIVGILYLRNLIGDKFINKTVDAAMQENVVFVLEDSKLDNTLDLFLSTRQHLFMVKDEFGDIAGLITLEDVVEEILSTEIIDEVDKHPDMRTYAKHRKRTS